MNCEFPRASKKQRADIRQFLVANLGAPDVWQRALFNEPTTHLTKHVLRCFLKETPELLKIVCSLCETGVHTNLKSPSHAFHSSLSWIRAVRVCVNIYLKILVIRRLHLPNFPTPKGKVSALSINLGSLLSSGCCTGVSNRIPMHGAPVLIRCGVRQKH